MPPVVLTLLQALFLLLLYVFVGRAVRAIARDLNPSSSGAGPLPRLRAPRSGAGRAAKRGRAKPKGLAKLGRSETRPEPAELVVHLPGGAPRVIPLDGDVGTAVTFGRAPDMTVPLEDPYASDRHARVYRTEEGWLVADLGSTNGTYRNAKKLTAPAKLAAGDQLAVGKTVVEVRR